MDIAQMVREELTAVVGPDNAENISSDVYDQVADGAAAARQALGSDLLYENFLGRQIRRLQAAEAEEAEAQRAYQRKWGKFFVPENDEPKPYSGRVPTSPFLE